MREAAAPCLAERTTLRLGGRAIAELAVESVADVLRLPERLRALGGRPLVLGRGSNILARGGELPLVLVRPVFSDGPAIIGEAGGHVLVRAGAGVRLGGLLAFCARHGLAGLEGLVGIPGTVGGAVAMNAGSFGTETGDRIVSVKAATGEGIREYAVSDLRFSYRSMGMQGVDAGFIVLSATFGLTRSGKGSITTTMRHNFFKKKSTQPVTSWSAGCVFKNPANGMSAGRLLDLAGFKGKKMGGMAFSTIHANFLVNEGKGDSAAALDLLREAREAVRRQFGVSLEPEVRIVP